MRLFTLSPYSTSLLLTLNTKQARPTIASSSFLRLESRQRRPVPVPRAGPSTNTLILAFCLPLSLLVATAFNAIKIADELDEKYMNEIEMNLAIMQENGMLNEQDVEENMAKIFAANEQEELVNANKDRNRPKQEI